MDYIALIKINTVFPLISVFDDILRLLGPAIIRGQRQLEGGAYFKVGKMNSIKCQKLVIFSFKIRIKHKFSLSINQI